jgi:methionyl-tRNA formyltransferase
MTARPSLLILCGRSPRHLYVANRLCRSADVVGIVQEVGRDWTWRDLPRKVHPTRIANKAWRWLRHRRHYAGGREAAFFFGDREPALERADLLVTVPHINHPRVVALARSRAPDLVAVFGTSLLRGETLSIGRLGILNLHGGLSPDYRGADCTFWALYNGEPERVGCTIHFIDAGIDTGRLIAHVCPAVEDGDDEMTLFWRAVRDSGDVYAQAVEQLARVYQVRQRTLRHELSLARRMKSGMLKGMGLGRRVRWFYVDGEAAGVYKPGSAGPGK